VRSDAALAEAAGNTTAAALTAILGDPAAVAGVGSVVSELISTLAGSSAVRSTLAELLGSPLGGVTAGLLANAEFVDAMAAQVGNAFPDFLGQTGVTAALAGTGQRIVQALVSGADLTGALTDALSALQANADFTSAVSSTVREALAAVLGSSQPRQALSDAAGRAVVGLIQQVGINIGFVNAIVDQVTRNALDTLLADPVVWNLVGDVTDKIVSGVPTNAVLNSVVDAVLRDSSLQSAIGFAVGRGIGSLFGDNRFGELVGRIVGAATTLQLALVSGIVRLFTGNKPLNLFGAPAGAAAVVATPPFVTDDLYVMTAAIPEAPKLSAIRQNLATDSRFFLERFELTVTDEAHDPDYLDVALTITDGTPTARRSDTVFVAFRFQLDRLIPEAAVRRTDRCYAA
ncbi:MAG: hypothetical protein KIH64_007540, partial [Mycobacterium sp.]|nr:hypothetical protein [Mycobacterium sp.]